ncbi:MAG TPA: S8 family serine peptidase, partial [Gemmatimonadales bacterium]|nr:S8 family serine peptidase [Gemmatimonadales bacterium]
APSQLGIAATDVTGAGGRNDGSGSAASGCPIAQEVANPDYTLCFGGTSAAAPLVSGIAGLVRSVKPNLSPAEVEQILRKTADKIPPGANASDVPYDAAGHSTTHGYGRVNAFCALRAAVAPAEPCKPVQTAAAATFEIGTRLGVSWLHNGGDQVVINAPGGGARAAPILSVAWFPTVHWMIDGQVGISFVQNSGIPPDEYRIVAAADLAYVTNPGGVSLYVGPGVGVQRFWSSGGPGSTEFGGGAIAGIRALPRPFLALRLEGAYRYWPAPNLHEFVLAFGFGVVLN